MLRQIRERVEEVKNFPKENSDMIKKILCKLENKFKGRRKIMYSDIINLIIREGIRGDIYNQLIQWCNYEIKLGKLIVEIY